MLWFGVLVTAVHAPKPVHAAPPAAPASGVEPLVEDDTSGHNCASVSARLVLEHYGAFSTEGLDAAIDWDDGVTLVDIEAYLDDRGLSVQSQSPDERGLDDWDLKIVAVRGPEAQPHYVIVWSEHAGMVEVSGPHAGRGWIESSELERLQFDKHSVLRVSAVPKTIPDTPEWVVLRSRTGLKLPVRIHEGMACSCAPALPHVPLCEVDVCAWGDALASSGSELLMLASVQAGEQMVELTIAALPQTGAATSIERFATDFGSSSSGMTSDQPHRGYDLVAIRTSTFMRFKIDNFFNRSVSYVLPDVPYVLPGDHAIILVSASGPTDIEVLDEVAWRAALTTSPRLPTSFYRNPGFYERRRSAQDERWLWEQGVKRGQNQAKRFDGVLVMSIVGAPLPWLLWVGAKGWPLRQRSASSSYATGNVRKRRPLLAAIPRPGELALGIGLILSHVVAVTVWFLAMLVLPVGAYLLFAVLIIGAVWSAPQAMSYPLGLLIGLGFGGVVTTISMLRVALRRSLIMNPESSNGVELSGLDGLFDGLNAGVRAQADFDKVLVSVGAVAHTEIHGGRRVVVLGAPVVELLEPQELRAVIAHEEAHHEHLGMTLVEIVWRAATSSQLLVELSSRPTALTLEFEIMWNGHHYIDLLESMFVSFSGAARYIMEPAGQLTAAAACTLSHRLEFACDRAAAGQVAAQTLLSALRKITVISVAWEFYLAIWCRPSEGRADLASFVEFLNSGVLLELKPFIMAAWHEESGRHPSGPRRAKALGLTDTGFDLGCEWRLGSAPALADPELRRVIELEIGASAFQVQSSHWALELIHARLSEDEREDLADNEDMIPAVIILARYMPIAEIFVTASELDPVSDTVLRGLEQMVMHRLLDANVVETRRDQLLKRGCPARPRLALELLVNFACFHAGHGEVRLAALRGHQHIYRRERLSESIARWRRHRVIAERNPYSLADLTSSIPGLLRQRAEWSHPRFPSGSHPESARQKTPEPARHDQRR
jgi:hypothetical protein